MLRTPEEAWHWPGMQLGHVFEVSRGDVTRTSGTTSADLSGIIRAP